MERQCAQEVLWDELTESARESAVVQSILGIGYIFRRFHPEREDFLNRPYTEIRLA